MRLTGDPATGPVFTAEAIAPAQVAIVRQVPAGSYRLVVTLAGFKEAVLDVLITAGATHEFLVELRPVGLGTADSVIRIAQTAPAANARVWDRSAVETFPGDDPISSIVETTVAPVIVDRMSTGGLWIGEAALVGGQAGSWRQTSIAIGTLDVTDPVRSGTPLARPPWESVETLIVATAMLPASARGPGPLLTVVPRTAGSVWRGDGEIGVMPGAMQADGTTNGVPAIAQFDGHHDASVVAGGPGREHTPVPVRTPLGKHQARARRPVATRDRDHVVARQPDAPNRVTGNDSGGGQFRSRWIAVSGPRALCGPRRQRTRHVRHGAADVGSAVG